LGRIARTATVTLAPPEQDEISSILPLEQSLRDFRRRRVGHGFRRIQAPPDVRGVPSRCTSTRKRVRARKPAPAHGTFYVQRTAIEIQAGYTLSEEDVQGLRDLLAAGTHKSPFLYEREMEFNDWPHSPSMRLVRLLTAPCANSAGLLRD